MPAGTSALTLTATLAGWASDPLDGPEAGPEVGPEAGPEGGPAYAVPGSGRSPSGAAADVWVTVEDRWGTPYRLPAGELAADGRERALTVDLSAAPLTLTGLELVMTQPAGDGEQHRLTVRRVSAAASDGTERRIPLPHDWSGLSDLSGPSLGEGGAGGPSRRASCRRRRSPSSTTPASRPTTSTPPPRR